MNKRLLILFIVTFSCLPFVSALSPYECVSTGLFEDVFSGANLTSALYAPNFFLSNGTSCCGSDSDTTYDLSDLDAFNSTMALATNNSVKSELRDNIDTNYTALDTEISEVNSSENIYSLAPHTNRTDEEIRAVTDGKINSSSWNITGGNTVLAHDGNVGIGTTAPDTLFTLKQSAANEGIKLYEAAVDNDWGHLYMSSDGRLNIDSSIRTQMRSSGATLGFFDSSALQLNDEKRLQFGGNADYSIAYNDATDSLMIMDGNTVGTNVRMLINSDGNVGIGTTTPNYLLEVNGSMTATQYRAPDNAAGVGFVDDGGNGIYVKDGGNVGIGTSSPSTRLHISESHTRVIPTDENIGDDGTLFIVNPNNEGNFSALSLETRTTERARALIGLEWTSAHDGDLFFRLKNSGSTSNEVMRLQSDGNVGIGTAIPSGIFHINSSSPELKIEATGGGQGRQIQLLSNGDKYNWMIAAQENKDNTLEFTPSTASGGTTFSTPAMTLNYDGNVGIGTTSPAHKLEVAGSMNISGGLNVSGTIMGNDIYAQACYHNHSGVEVSFSEANVFYNMTFNVSTLRGFSTHSDYGLVVEYEGRYKVSGHMIGSGENNHEYVATVGVNGIEKICPGSHMKLAAGGDTISMPINGFVDLYVDDVVSGMVQDYGDTSTGTYYGMNLVLVRIGDIE